MICQRLVRDDLFADFKPLPGLGHPHVQTLLGQILSGAVVTMRTRRRVLQLSDGDGLFLYDTIPPTWKPGDSVAVLVHGLTGSHASAGMQRPAVMLLHRGVRVVRFDQRGAGPGLALARGCYNAGRSEDLRAVLEEVGRWCPASPLLVYGNSLGGNVVLKLLGEAATAAVPRLWRAAVIAPPIDLERCSLLLERPQNRIYERYFVAGVIAEAQQRQRLHAGLPPLCFPRRMSLRQFDDLYTAPRGGFHDAAEYYHRCSSAPLVPRIRVPTLILTARDDPFIAVEPFEELVPPPTVQLRIIPKGGHVGFLGRDGSGGIRWGERRVVEWLLQDGTPNGEDRVKEL